ncbi:hypothetical protein D3Y59_01915 [Hymenobacter oligotrophus]|uniref:Polyhydroxyalkanoate synthesis regulator n=1 Tax=Hymenobacter oligotrophus TaxID=2319843 RepID=A0A3B7QVU3_9BACT|nr:hypothetical protein [Hymenobacter oligotrophus]AYA35914.1 hypothetical protein D3Y59_01915 [Hymenobacter oligotrophus]
MEDLFKKFIYAGVGFVSRTNDRVQDTINQLVQENKLSQTEGQKILNELQKNTDTKRKEFETQINSIAKRVMKGMGVASNADVEELKKAVKGPGSKASSSATKPAGTASASKTKSTTAKKADSTTAAAPAKKAASGGSKSSAAKKSSSAAATGSTATDNA